MWWKKIKKIETCIVHDVATNKEIYIPKAQASHLIELIANQVDAIDDDRLENDLYDMEHYANN